MLPSKMEDRVDNYVHMVAKWEEQEMAANIPEPATSKPLADPRAAKPL